MSWTATVRNVGKNLGNVTAIIDFVESSSNETITETLRADDLTQERIQEFCYFKIQSLNARDASLTALQSQVGQPVTPRAPGRPTYQIISSKELLAWSAKSGRMQKLKNAASNGANDEVKSLAAAAVLMIERDGTSLDFNLSDRRAMLEALVAASVLSESDKTSLYTLAAW